MLVTTLRPDGSALASSPHPGGRRPGLAAAARRPRPSSPPPSSRCSSSSPSPRRCSPSSTGQDPDHLPPRSRRLGARRRAGRAPSAGSAPTTGSASNRRPAATSSPALLYGARVSLLRRPRRDRRAARSSASPSASPPGSATAAATRCSAAAHRRDRRPAHPGLRARADWRRAARLPAAAAADPLVIGLARLGRHRPDRPRPDPRPEGLDYVAAARLAAAAPCGSPGASCCPRWPRPSSRTPRCSSPTNMIAEAALSFLGVGVKPPTPSWGQMLSTADDLVPGRPACTSCCPPGCSSSPCSPSPCSATASARPSTRAAASRLRIGTGRERGASAA